MFPPLCTIPIYIPHNDGALYHYGSGVTLFYKNRYFIGTAAHVTDGNGFSDELTICTSQTSYLKLPQCLISTPKPSGNRSNDIFDLSVIPISEDDAKKLGTIGFTFIGLDDAEVPLVKPGDELKFMGFPGVEQKICYLANGMWFEQHPISIKVYQVEEDEALSVGFPLKTHLVARYVHPSGEHKRKGEFEILLPEGMSGGVVWQHLRGKFTFAGVITRWNQKGHLIATRSNYLTAMLDRAIRS